MKMIRLYADADGVSHFADADIDFAPKNFAPPAPALDVSTTQDAVSLTYVRVPADWPPDWHPSPYPQVWVGLSGALEITAGDGEKRIIEPGVPWLMEDTYGRGHSTRAVGGEAAVGAITRLA